MIATGTDALTINNSGLINGTGGVYNGSFYQHADGIILGAGGGTITNNASAAIIGNTGEGSFRNMAASASPTQVRSAGVITAFYQEHRI